MRNTIQIANLGYSMDNRDLARLFTPYGAVHSAVVCIHRNSGQSTGAGFVEMESTEQGEAAIAALNGRLHCGRVLSLRWSSPSPMPDATPAVQFGPMNLVDEVSAPREEPERRGLPE